MQIFDPMNCQHKPRQAEARLWQLSGFIVNSKGDDLTAPR